MPSRLYARLHHGFLVSHLASSENLLISSSFLARSAKVAERAICFTDRNFFLIFLIFFNDFSETNYLKVHWTDFRNLYVK